MPWKNERDLPALRIAYKVAVTTHAECSRTLTEVLVRGETATADLIEAEANARYHKEMTRRKLHAALATALDAPPEQPASDKLVR